MLLERLSAGFHNAVKCFSEVVSNKALTHFIQLMCVNTNLIHSHFLLLLPILLLLLLIITIVIIIVTILE